MSFPPEEPPVEPQGAMPPDLEAEAPPTAPSAARQLLPERYPDAVDYTVRLEPEALARLGKRLSQQLQSYEVSVQQRRENCRAWERELELVQADGVEKWANDSQLRVPYTALAVMNHHATLNEAIQGSKPAFSAIGGDEAGNQAAPIAEDVLQSKLVEAKWDFPADELHLALPLDGVAAIGSEYVIETGWRPVVQVEEHRDAELRVQATADATGDPEAAVLAAFKTDAKGQLKRSVDHEEVITREGHRLWFVPFRDLVVLPAHAKRKEQVWAYGEYVRVTGMDLAAGAASGKYLQEAVDKLLARHSDQPRSFEDQAEAEENTGISYDASGPDDEPAYREYELCELDWYGDLEGKGRNKWHILALHPETETVLRCQYSPYEHMRSRYTLFNYLPRHGQLFGASVAERMAGIQDAATATLNQLINVSDILVGNASSWLYDYTTGKKQGEWQNRIGAHEFVRNVNGVKEKPGTQALAAAMMPLLQTLRLLKEWADLLSASSNLSFGNVSEGDKTLGEVDRALAGGNKILSTYVERVAKSWAEVADLIRWNEAQYARDGRVEYRVTASPGEMIERDDPQNPGQPQQVPGRMVWQTDPSTGEPVQVPVEGGVGYGQIPARLLKQKIDWIPTALGQIPDREGRLKRDAFIMELSLKHPVISQLPEVLLKVYNTVLDSSQFPGREDIMNAAQEGLQLMQQMQAQQAALQQAQAVMEMQQGVQTQQQAGQQQEHAMQMANRSAEQKDAALLLQAADVGNNGSKGSKKS